MTGAEFERKFCQWAKENNWWALNIPHSKAGQQPFDVIAIKGSAILACDCKVISSKSNVFPLSRVEDNQWLAFASLEKKSPFSIIGLAIWHNPYSQMFFIPYKMLRIARDKGQASVELGPKTRLEHIDMLWATRQLYDY